MSDNSARNTRQQARKLKADLVFPEDETVLKMDLEACPFCGLKDSECIGVEHQYHRTDGEEVYAVTCYGCFARGSFCFNEAEAVRQWNRANKHQEK